jgi:hypothetical protein
VVRLVRWIAVGLLGLTLACLAAAASAQAPTGQITGRVTDDTGAGIANIVVAAAPVSSPDSFTEATTDATGSYSLTLPPGDYDVAFNTQDPVNDTYNGVTFGGPGPGPGAVCTICGGQAVTVTAGGVTANIGAALSTGTPPQTGTIRPLSGTAIKIHAGRLTFNFGCHVEPTGCIGTARLRFAPNGPTIATLRVVVDPNRIGRLVFQIPASISARVRRTHLHSVAALVEVTTPPGHFITHFRLVNR